MEQLIKTAEGILSSCLAVKEGEEVLIVTDDTRKRIGEALYEAAGNLGCERLLMVMKERELSGQEPPKAVAAAAEHPLTRIWYGCRQKEELHRELEWLSMRIFSIMKKALSATIPLCSIRFRPVLISEISG